MSGTKSTVTNFHSHRTSQKVQIGALVVLWTFLRSVMLLNDQVYVYGQTMAETSSDRRREQQQYSFSDLKPCTLTSVELANIGPDDNIEPCILYDEQPTNDQPISETNNDGIRRIQELINQTDVNVEAGFEGGEDNNSTISNQTNTNIFTIPIVQVTPSSCNNHRDGALTGVKVLNADNNFRGIAIGYQRGNEHGEQISPAINGDELAAFNNTTTASSSSSPSLRFVQFRLVSIVAGNPSAMTEQEYEIRHTQLLSSMLETLQAPYIVGSCTIASAIEKGPANEHNAIIMAQVGPPGFYEDSDMNPYVFGFHINSDTYPLPAVQSLALWAKEKHLGGPPNVPVRVVARTKSEFFASTCQSAIAALQQQGFTDLEQYWMDHAADEDGDDTINEFDEDYLTSIADRSCPANNDPNFNPALFVCTRTEQTILVRRWLDNGCRPVSLWLTASTWGWATDNPEMVPYFQGGGQWHESFDYSDKFFPSGLALIEHNKKLYGYTGTYDQVVSYAIPLLYAEHLITAYRVVDDPDPVADFASEEGRERLRRDMVVLSVDSIFGPIAFDGNKRNVGRGAAGTQWLRQGEVGKGQEGDIELLYGDSGGNTASGGSTNVLELSSRAFTNTLVAPFLQASASTVVPSPSGDVCDAGKFGNETSRKAAGAMLAGGCTNCPVNTFLPISTLELQCLPCPRGSSTNGDTGQVSCVSVDDNLLSTGVLAFGYVMVSLTWLLALGFLSWLWMYRSDPVVNVSQKEFLILICVGAMISSSTIIALSFQAGSGEVTEQASTACSVAPYLYTIGWALQYSSLTAKTFRLFTIMKNNQNMRRVKVTFRQMSLIVVLVLVIDIAILIAWTIVSPLVYRRSQESININADSDVITVETVGSCVMKDPNVSFWAFAGPIMAFHFLLLILTNVLLCFVRNVSDRYQEQKYVGLASMLMFEVLIVGLPVLFAVNDSPTVTHIILVGIISLADMGILCFTFVPKIFFQRAGLEEGVGFGESILKETYRRASTREMVRRDSRFDGGSRVERSSEFERQSMSSNNMAAAAAIVRSGAFASPSKRPSWAENISTDGNDICPDSVCESNNLNLPMASIDEEIDLASASRTSQDRLISGSEEEVDGDESKDLILKRGVDEQMEKVEVGEALQDRTGGSAGEGTATTTSLTDLNNSRPQMNRIPLIIETDSTPQENDSEREADS